MTMETLADITDDFTTTYTPTCALVFHETDHQPIACYVEYYDIDKKGQPRNAHPLSLREAQRLRELLEVQEQQSKGYLKPEGLLSQDILHIDPTGGGSVLWYTKAAMRPLYFSPQLGLPNGKAAVPPLLWKATRTELSLYALATDKRPSADTSLYHAPFFNLYQDGKVCMGNVSVRISASTSLEAFTTAWEHYFFNSYFSHLLQGHNPVQGNCVSLWKELLETGDAFPKSVLIKTKKTLKNLLV